MHRVARLVSFVGVAVVYLSTSAFAVTPVPCNASFTACSIIENASLQLPFTAIAGDVIVRDPGPLPSVISSASSTTWWIRAGARA